MKRLKGEICDLHRKLAGLAAQVELRDEKRLRELYEQRGHEVNRLISQTADLARSLEDDLVVERAALRELTGQPVTVTNIRFDERPR